MNHPARLRDPRVHFYLAVIADGTFVGITGLESHTKRQCLSHLHGEFGWYFVSEAWNRGVATKATQLILQLAFAQLHLPSVSATCDPANTASRRVLEKNGLSFVDEQPQVMDTWRGPRPRLMFRMTRDEWHER